MKTLKIFIVLCFIAAFAVSNIKAQNRVIKEEIPWPVVGGYCPCTNEYLFGELTVDFMLSSHNGIYKLRDGILYGSTDKDVLKPSGNVYEVSQVSPGGSDWYECTVIYRIDGKIVAEAHFSLHYTINGNDDIIVDRSTENWNCKD